MRSVLDGSVFAYRAGYTEWDFRVLGPRFLAVSFQYTALPGAIGIGLGTVAGAAWRRRHRGLADQVTDLALATPDFLVILVAQVAAAWFADVSGLGTQYRGAGLSPLPLAVMCVFPFFLARRAAAEASRRAEGEEYIAYARAKGLPESAILRRHIGAAILPALRAELPVIIAFMQGSLFITERAFGLPGMAKLFFDSAFAGRRSLMLRSVYQYNLVVVSLVGLAVSCVAVYAALRLGLAAARKALTRE